MLKKTTVYLSEEELSLLRKMANIRNITIAEAIRRSIQDSCKPQSKEEKTVWAALDKIWAKTKETDEDRLEKDVLRFLLHLKKSITIHDPPVDHTVNPYILNKEELFLCNYGSPMPTNE